MEKPKLLFNERYNYAFPFVNEVNSTLYFSSDVEGGIGGYDIYIRTFNNDNFTDLVNLGPQINSPKHDINPTIIDNWLYFSSNGFVSYGGYDIYKYKSSGDYSHVFRNCSDLNTHKDEIGVFGLSQRKITVYRDNDSSILLSSYEQRKLKSRFLGTILNSKNQPISGAVILIPEESTYVETDIDGNFEYSESKGVDSIEIKIVAEKYLANSTYISTGKVENIIMEEISAYKAQREINPRQVITLDSQTQKAKGINDTLYYIILESTYEYQNAYMLWNQWLESFSEAEIFSYDNGLYRVGFKAGRTESEALATYRQAAIKKKDIWILRPPED
jgi:hypothetical protein